MGEHRDGAPAGRTNGYRVRVYRVGPTETATALLLAGKMAGVLTHWRGRAGAALCVKECPPATHSAKTQWKGYLPAMLYHADQAGAWYPTLLEVTEHAELDLRSGFERGEVWQFVKSGENKSSPMRARFTGQRLSGPWIPLAFDARPLLRTLYHVHGDFRADVPNPLPAHVMVQAIMGHALDGLGAELEGAEPTAEQRREALEKLRSRLRPGKDGDQ